MTQKEIDNLAVGDTINEMVIISPSRIHRVWTVKSLSASEGMLFKNSNPNMIHLTCGDKYYSNMMTHKANLLQSYYVLAEPKVIDLI